MEESKVRFVANTFVRFGVHGLGQGGHPAHILTRRMSMQQVLDLLGLHTISAPMPPEWINGEYVFTVESPRHSMLSVSERNTDKLRRRRQNVKAGGRGIPEKAVKNANEILSCLLRIINRTPVNKQARVIGDVLLQVLKDREQEGRTPVAFGKVARAKHKKVLDWLKTNARNHGATKVELVSITTRENLCSWFEFRQVDKAEEFMKYLEKNYSNQFEVHLIRYHHGSKGPALRIRVPDSMLGGPF